MARGAAVAALLQLAVVCSVAVSIQYAPGEGDGLTGNATVADDGAGGTSRFTVRIRVPKGKSASKEPQAKLMGWQLGSEAGGPVRVLKIRGKGIVARHNADNAERPIVAGDELVEVNGVKWTGDTRAFEAALGKEIQATMMAKERLLRFTVQRRKQAEQAPKALAQAAESQEETQIGEQKANTSANVPAMGSNLLEEKAANSADSQVELSVSKVEGLIAAWNKLHPEDPIELDPEAFRKAMGMSLVSRRTVDGAGGEQAKDSGGEAARE